MKVNMGQPNNDLLIDDLELLLREIDEFNTATGNNKPVDIPQTLDNYLQFVAKSGNTVFPWPHVRVLFRSKMLSAIQQFQEPIDFKEEFILERFDMFRIAAPFTIQRLAELILQPTRHYRKKEKFLRGLEKTVLVVSTIEPRSLTGEEEKNGNDDAINTSGSSGEGETEQITFNRTFTVDQHDMVTVRSSPIDVLQNIPITSDIVLDPVTTSVVSTGVDIISPIINVAPDGILADTVTTSCISSVDVITPDITIAVSSDSIILNTVADASAGVVIGSGEDLVTDMECESSTTAVDVSPVAMLQCVVDQQDLVSTAIAHASVETLPHTVTASSVVIEDVSSSLANMDAVKLPLEETCNVSVDCHSSAVPETTETASLFHGVAVAPIVDESALVTPILAEEPCVDTPILTSSESEPTIVDVPTSLGSADKSNVLVDFEPHGSVEIDTIASAMECQSTEEPPSIIPNQPLENTESSTAMDVSVTLPQAGTEESAELESGVELSSSDKTTEQTPADDTVVETSDPSSEVELAPNAEIEPAAADDPSNSDDSTSGDNVVADGEEVGGKPEEPEAQS